MDEYNLFEASGKAVRMSTLQSTLHPVVTAFLISKKALALYLSHDTVKPLHRYDGLKALYVTCLKELR